jgi:NAD(P)-dependent dehydrogenase (short-subunit alcohol dehydrogenase family)
VKLRDKVVLVTGGAQWLGRPEECASLAASLAGSGHLVGQTISPNGGMIL